MVRKRAKRSSSSASKQLVPKPKAGTSVAVSRRARRRLGRPIVGGASITAYIATLNDPFSYPPIKLGWGTFVPTQIYTCYLRGNFTTNADGSFAIVMLPSIGNSNGPVFINNAGASSGTWGTQVSLSNTSAVAAAITEARIVSGGLRVLPQVPATAVPGVIFAGDIPSGNVTAFTTASPSGLSLSPSLNFGFGATGATALIRPLDPESFMMQAINVYGYSGSIVTTSSVPLVVGLGFPASTTVYYEAVINVEGIPNYNNASAALQGTGFSSTPSETPASMFPSLENMWQYVSSKLSPGGIVETLASGAQTAMRYGPLAMRGINAVRNARRQYFPPLEGAINRTLIEEVL